MLTIRPLEEKDISACLDIYNWYIENTTVTFEEIPLSETEFSARVRRILAFYPYFVAELDGKVIGYAYLDCFNPRSAYRYTADLSVYVDRNALASGVGTALLKEIERSAKEQGIRQIVSLVTSANEESRHFHERRGFRHVGQLEDVGWKMNTWLGVDFYQKDLKTIE